MVIIFQPSSDSFGFGIGCRSTYPTSFILPVNENKSYVGFRVLGVWGFRSLGFLQCSREGGPCSHLPRALCTCRPPPKPSTVKTLKQRKTPTPSCGRPARAPGSLPAAANRRSTVQRAPANRPWPDSGPGRPVRCVGCLEARAWGF